MSYELMVSFDEVLNLYRKNHEPGNKELIRTAYDFAKEKHDGIFRSTGESYIYHPVRTAKYVAEWGFDSDVIAAALLHDVVEDCDVSLDEICRLFGEDVSGIVDAVTSLSDKDFKNNSLSKAQKDLLSDVRLQQKMNGGAIYVKIADRIDNLNTIRDVPEEKRVAKARHTEDIIIPMAKNINAYHLVDVLEDLCLQAEHPELYKEISEQYRDLCTENKRICTASLGVLTKILDPGFDDEVAGLERVHRYINDFVYTSRSCSSIYRHITNKAENIKKDWRSIFAKANIALYDLTLVVDNKLSDDNAILKPNDIFFEYFDKILSRNGFYIIKYNQSKHDDIGFFLISDEMDNLYRLFVRTEIQYQRFLYGNMIDADYSLKITDVNEIEPRETFNEKIKVFRRDGSSMLIDKGATVLDFAFYIHSEIGYHFDYALSGKSKAHLPKHTRLNHGDMITIVTNSKIKPDYTWFRYAKTSRSVDFLIRYFNRNTNSGHVTT